MPHSSLLGFLQVKLFLYPHSLNGRIYNQICLADIKISHLVGLIDPTQHFEGFRNNTQGMSRQRANLWEVTSQYIPMA